MIARAFARAVLWAVVWALLLAVPRATAQSVSQVLFLPQVHHVGDIVEARVVIRSTRTLNLTVPEILPRLNWIIVHGVSTLNRPDGVEVRILFQPFFVGTRTLPVLELGDFNVTGISTFVTPLAGADLNEAQPIRDQLLLPGTRLLIAVAVLLFFGVPVVIWFAGGWGTRVVRTLIRRYRESRPFRQALRSLRALSADLHEIDGKRFYIRLLDVARGYFARRLDPRILSATTGELRAYLTHSGLTESTVLELVELFRVGDLVKFANQRIAIDERQNHLRDTVRLITIAHKMPPQRGSAG